MRKLKCLTVRLQACTQAIPPTIRARHGQDLPPAPRGHASGRRESRP